MVRSILTLLAFIGTIHLNAQNILFYVQHASCGNTTGSILASVSGGTAPYTFLWSPAPPSGQGTSSIQGLFPGSYTLTVTDGSGNTSSSTTEVLLIGGLFPDLIPATPAWSCDDLCNGSFYYYIPLNGGVMPYTVTFDPAGPTGGASPNGLYFNNLCPGLTYTVTVSDANGCSGTVGPIEVLGEMTPEIISVETTGSCPGGSTGTLMIEFTEVDSIYISGPNGTIWLESTNPFYAENLAAGTYAIAVYNSGGGGVSNPPGTSGFWCSAEYSVEVPVSTDPCGSIGGVVYADLGGDCTQNMGDLGLPYRLLTIAPGDHLVMTNATGVYYTELFYDDYALDAAIAGYDVVCPPLPASFSLSASTPTASIDVAMDPLMGPDVSTFLSAGVHRPGFPVNYQVQVHNEGPYGFTDLTLELFFDPIMIINDADGGTLVGPGHLQWSIASLGGFTTLSYTVGFTVPANQNLTGTVVTGTATVSGTSPDADPTNDSYSITRTIVNAYDPNDKLVQTSSRLSGEHYFLDQDSWVDYTIRFQNTGSAEAINVYLLDTIAPEFDLLSLQLLGASHTFEASLQPGRVLRFDFPNIMLPDSTSDLAGSQGFASFRLRPTGVPTIGTVLHNAADIFFDFNDPIRTNDADLLVEFSVGMASPGTFEALIHPNPVVDLLQVIVPDGNWTTEIFTVDGRRVATGRAAGDRLTVDASALAPGSYLLRLTNAFGAIQNARFMKR